ncbi:NAD(P)-dependent oxidoreductase [Alcaligenaceae bacterium]|nr:NAD(P)-dependent oxidoreductase [Alcaligenaceae bacterium]
MENRKPVLGFIGLGVMGNPISSRFLAAGYPVIGYDVSPSAMDSFSAAGGQGAESALEVANSASIVFTSLPSIAVFRQVIAGAGGLIDGSAVKVVVDLSTVGGTATMEVAGALQGRNIELVDAPVSGGAAGARAGTLAVMIAGSTEAVERVMPILQILGKTFRVGDQAGHGQLMKLLNNMLSSTALAVTAEAYVAGTRAGLDPQTMMDVFNAGSGRNNATSDKFPKHVLPGTFDFGFPISSVCKDIGLAIEECQAFGVPMWLGGQARQIWQAAATQGGATDDLTSIVNIMERWSSDRE